MNGHGAGAAHDATDEFRAPNGRLNGFDESDSEVEEYLDSSDQTEQVRAGGSWDIQMTLLPRFRTDNVTQRVTQRDVMETTVVICCVHTHNVLQQQKQQIQISILHALASWYNTLVFSEARIKSCVRCVHPSMGDPRSHTHAWKALHGLVSDKRSCSFLP